MANEIKPQEAREAAAQMELENRASNEIQMLDTHLQYEKALEMAPKKIGEKEIQKATSILQKYKSGKASLEKRLIAHEQFWKMRQWEGSEASEYGYQPATAWLNSCIESRYSDVMDSYPTCNFVPRQQDDKEEAKKLSSIIPVVLEQNRYEDTYSDSARYMLKHGGCVQGVFWDPTKHNGLGDISVKNIDFINLFYEPAIKNIQDSPHVFHTELVDNDILEQRYPQCKGKLSGHTITLAKYLYDDQVDTTQKSVVVDWYYHTEKNGRRALQYVKYVNDIVLYATENETTVPTKTEVDAQTGIPLILPNGEAISERGLYDHQLYPFVTASLFPIEGSLCGYGLTDIGRDCQIQIDLISNAITQNAVIAATPRYFIRNDGSINEDEFINPHKHLIHVEGNVGEENIRTTDANLLTGTYVNILNQKIEEMKFTTSNQDAANGVAQSGVTAASAIAALQEAAGKNARSTNRTFHRMYRDVCYQIVELIRQFYSVPRQFRIVPDAFGEQFVTYSNNGLVEQQQNIQGQDMGLRLPEFDIEVTSEKSDPYKKMERNELALSFYQQGFFNPQMADQALSCLEMMDFEHKDEIVRRIMQNGTTQQLLLQFEQIAMQLAAKYEPQTADKLGQMVLSIGGQPIPQAQGPVDLSSEGDEHPYVEKARAQARESTQDV